MAVNGMLSPFVFWAQTEDRVSLKIDLKDCKDSDILLNPEKLQFSAFGKGAKGSHKYGFTLHFFLPLNPEESTHRVLESKVEFSLKKQVSGFWPRLISSPQKPVWLKIDFDKWKSEDADFDEEDGRDVMKDYPGLYDQLQKEERGYRIEDYKKVYLVLYNLFQFVCFLYILTVLGIEWSKHGADSMSSAYENVGTAVKLCHLFMWLEVLHPIFGYTKNSVWAPLMQVGGRNVVLFLMIEAEPRMQVKPVVFYLIVIWSAVEIIRYPYYVSQLYKLNIGLLTWLRYTIWIPLYPLGTLCEGVIILRNIPYCEETLRFTVSLPNAWNFAFHFPTVLRIYLLTMFFPGLYVLMSHMYRDRVKKLGSRSWRRKSD